MTDLASLCLYVATSDQSKESLRRAYTTWGKGAPFEEYENRDAIWAEEFECAKEGGLTTWVLAPRDDPETLDFKCACRTFKWPALTVSTKTHDQVKPGNCYTVCSVFTPPKHRGQGYAAHMMRLLHWIIAPDFFLRKFTFPADWGSPPSRRGDAVVSTLYSDIGHDFYRSCGPVPLNEGAEELGWVVSEPLATCWDVESYSGDIAQDTGLRWRWLDEDGVKEQCNRDEDVMKDTLARKEFQSGAAFAILPSRGVEHFSRARFRQSLEDHTIDIKWGIAVEDASGETTGYASWIIEPPFPTSKLLISRLRVDNEAHFIFVLERIIKLARSLDMTTVEIWNVPQEYKDMTLRTGGVEAEREKKLSSFKWYGDEVDVDWLFNERYCWV